jgi:hypothetical protein
MTVKEGTYTISSHHFIPEVLNDSSAIDTKFYNWSQSLLIEGNPPGSNQTYSLGSLGNFSGYWSFWDELHPIETDYFFNFAPQYEVLETEFELDQQFQSRYEIRDYKLSPRLLYYPFGLFVVRFRVYLEFKNSQSVKELARLLDALEDNIHVFSRDYRADPYLAWYSRDDSVVTEIFREVSRQIFDSSIPDTHQGYLGNKRTYPVNYIYQSEKLSDGQRAQLISRDARPLADHTISGKTDSKFGKIAGDQIYPDSSGMFVRTPYFQSISAKNRRWKRIQLLNNLYLASDIAIFERDYVQKLSDPLEGSLDGFTSGTLMGTPLSKKFLFLLRELLRFGPQLRVLRGQIYEALEPSSKTDLHDRVIRFTDREIDHESTFREFAKSLFSFSL